MTLNKPILGMASTPLAQSTTTASPTTSTVASYVAPHLNAKSYFSAHITSSPTRIKTSAGWVGINTNLSKKSSGVIAPKASLGHLSLSNGGKGAFAKMLSGKTGSSKSHPISVSFGSSSLPTPKLSGSSATYSNVSPGTDLVVKSLGAGLDARIILHKAPVSTPTYNFTYHLGNLHLVKAPKGNGMLLENKSGKVLGYSQGPQMWGAKLGKHSKMPISSSSVAYSLSTNSGVTTLSLHPSASFLHNSSLAYPVTIDPSLTLSDAGDSYVDSGYYNSNYSTSAGLHVGTYNSGTNVDRALMSFPTSSIPSGAQVSSATLNAYEYWAWSCSAETVVVNPLTSGWNPSTVTWNTQPSWGSVAASANVAHGYSSSCPAAWVPFNITSLTQSWVNGSQPNYGVMLASGNEPNNYFWKKFSSRNNSTNTPYISVTYNTTPNTPTGLSDGNGTSSIKTLTPSLGGTYSNSDGASGNLNFQVKNPSGTVVGQGSSPTVASGTTTSWTPPSNALWVGQGYSFITQSCSNGLCSPWSAPFSFSVSKTLGAGQRNFSSMMSKKLDFNTSLGVNESSGNLYLSLSDLSIPGVGLTNLVSQSYNSTSNSTSSLGHKWQLNVGPGISLVPKSNGNVTFVGPGGYKALFSPNGSGGFNTPGGVDATLTKSGSSYSLVWHSSGSFHSSGQTMTFASGSYLTSAKASTGQTINYSYTNGQLSSITDTIGRTVSFSYNSSGQLSSIVDNSSNRTISFTYDSNNNLASVTNPAGGVTKFSYNTTGLLSSVITPAGRQTNISYNSSSQVTSFSKINSTGGTSPTWSFSYTGGSTTPTSFTSGQTILTGPRGNKTTYSWNNADLVTGVTDALGQAKSYKWNSDSNIVSSKSPNGTVAYAWNATTDVLQKATLPNGARTSFTYASSNPTYASSYVPSSSTDPQGNTLNYSYNGYSQVTNITQGSTTLGKATYDGQGGVSCPNGLSGQLCSLTNANGAVTNYSYYPAGSSSGPQGSLATISPPTPLGQTTYTYDGSGRPTSVTNGNGQKTTYSWNANNEMTKQTYSDGTSTSYSYGPDGNLGSKTNSSGTTSFTYNSLGQLASSTNPNSTATNYSYDPAGSLVSLSNSTGVTKYSYNAIDKVTSATPPWASATTFTYNSSNDSQLGKLSYPNGVSQSYSYTNGMLSKIVATNSSGTVLKSYSYSYTNPANLPTSFIYSSINANNYTTNYTYNSQNALSSAKQTNSTGGVINSYSYGYDPAGNRTSSTVNGTTTNYTYNSASQLTSQGASYDSAGNLTSGTGFSSLSYNPASQTSSVTPSGSAASSLSYQGGTQSLLSKAASTSFSYDSLGIASMTTNGQSTNLLRAPTGQFLGQNSSSGTYYPITNSLGSVVALTNSSGAIAQSYQYSPYGRVISSTGNTPSLFGFAGGVNVPGAGGLVHFGARFYNPSVGQWTQLDPTGQSAGYQYAGDNPVNYIDGSGLSLSQYVNSCGKGSGIGIGVGLFGIDETPGGIFVAGVGGCAQGIVGTFFTNNISPNLGSAFKLASIFKASSDLAYG